LKLPEQKSVNIMILVDSSGSMAGKVDGGVKMDLAKNAVREFSKQMPEGANVSLVAYGHKGSNQSKDKAISCKGIEEVYPLGAYDEGQFNRALGKFKPVGYTPLADSLKYAQKKLSNQKNAENIVYVVSDGIETCGGDPVKAAKELNSSSIKAVVNIIGFDLNDEGQRQLKAVADAGGGKYSSVDSKVELDKYFEEERRRLYNAWSAWAREHYNNAANVARKKINELERITAEFRSVANREEKRFDRMSKYLEEERGFEFQLLYNHVKKKYRERAGYLRDYRMYIESKLKQQVWDERDKIQDHVTDKRDEEQDKLY
jgi:Ca-activated chloride channel family protein